MILWIFVFLVFFGMFISYSGFIDANIGSWKSSHDTLTVYWQ